MRLGLLILLALAAGAFAAHWILGDAGYVLIEFRGWTVEMSVPALVVALVAIYFAVRLVVWLLQLPRQAGAKVGELRARRSQKNLDRAFAALAEGQWSRGEKLLGRAGGGSASLAGYLVAARAAQQQDALERRDEWLRLAYEVEPGSGAAVLLTQAELQLERGQLEEALAVLRRLETESPDHPRGLALQARVMERLGDWDGLEALLPRVRARRALDTAALEALAVRLRRERLSGADTAEALDAAWAVVPKELRNNVDVLEAYAAAGMRLGRGNAVEKALRRALSTEWRPRLVSLYGRLESGQPSAQLAAAENWLRDRPEDPELLLACGRLCLRSELWGKARSYLETALAIRPTPEAWRIYGELLVRLGESGAASEAFRQGLAAAAGGTAPALAAAASVPRLQERQG